MANFNQTLKGLDNTEVLDQSNAPVTLGKLLSTQLANASKGDALKYFSWATKLYNGEELVLDLSDEQTLKEFIKSSDNLTILAKAQLLMVLN